MERKTEKRKKKYSKKERGHELRKESMKKRQKAQGKKAKIADATGSGSKLQNFPKWQHRLFKSQYWPREEIQS